MLVNSSNCSFNLFLFKDLAANCIPVLKDKIAYNYLEDLPHVIINDWSDLTFDFLKSELDRIQQDTYNFNKINLSYWKNKIEESRKLL